MESTYRDEINHTVIVKSIIPLFDRIAIYWRRFVYIIMVINLYNCVLRKLNIMDSMIQKLESYATNLEDIVTRRTMELIEEKKKTDLLLHRMLPQ